MNNILKDKAIVMNAWPQKSLKLKVQEQNSDHFKTKNFNNDMIQGLLHSGIPSNSLPTMICDADYVKIFVKILRNFPLEPAVF
jgi:hypothetical protein